MTTCLPALRLKQTTDTTNSGLSVPDGSDDSPKFNEIIGGSTVKTQVELDSMISVGGRLGWLATPNTLLMRLQATRTRN